MFPPRASIRARERQLLDARQRTLAARASLRRSARNAAVSPRGLLIGFTLGAGIGRKLKCDTGKPRSGRRLRSLSLLLPLLRLI